MGNQQSLPAGSPAPQQQHNPLSSPPTRSRQSSNAAAYRNANDNPPASTYATTVDPALLAEYQRLRKEILDDPAFSNEALLPFEDESTDISLLNQCASTPWSKPPPSEINKQKGYRVPDTSGYYDDSGTTFNDLVDTRKFPPPGPPSRPISGSYPKGPEQPAATGTGAGGYHQAEAPGRSRAPTDASAGRGGPSVAQTRDGANSRGSKSQPPAPLPPGMPVRVNQNGDVAVDLVLEDGTPLQLRQAKRQFDRDKFKRANQQSTGEVMSPAAPTVQPHVSSAAAHKDEGPDPHTIPLPNSPLKPILGTTPPHSSPTAVAVGPSAGPSSTSSQPRVPSASNVLSDTDEALMDEILRLV